MFEDNLFSSLKKSAPKEQITPEENFVTRSLVYVLNYDSAFKNNFLRLFTKNTGLRLNLSTCECKAEAQKHYENSYIDIELEVETNKRNIIIFIEAKINARQNPGQLKKYLQIAKDKSRNNKKFYVAYLTFANESLERDVEEDKGFIGQFFWDDVYGCGVKHPPFLTKQFLKYMEGESMKLKKINKAELKSFVVSHHVMTTFGKYLERISPLLLRDLGEFEKPHEEVKNNIWSKLPLKGGKLRWYIGFCLENFPKTKKVTCCYVSLYFKSEFGLRKGVSLEESEYPMEVARIEEIYCDNDHTLVYAKPLSDVIKDKDGADQQIQKIKKFFEKGIKAIKGTPEYKRLIH